MVLIIKTESLFVAMFGWALGPVGRASADQAAT